MPCLLPNVELPVVAEGDFYPVYFSRGVLLEADLMASLLAEQMAGSSEQNLPQRLVQIYRSGDIGEAAAQAMGKAATTLGLKVENRPLSANATDHKDVAQALGQLTRGDALVLWLRPADLAALPPVMPPLASVVMSGTLADLERAPLPADWRLHTQMTYPFDLPEGRKVRMNFPLSWFKIKQIPLVAERVQTDTYIACGVLAET